MNVSFGWNDGPSSAMQVSSQGRERKKKYCNFNEGGPAHSKTRYLIDYTRDRKSRWRSSPPRRLETKVGSNKAIIVLKLLPRYLKLLTASGIHPRDCNKGEDKTESVLQRVGRNFPTPVHRPDSKSRRFVHWRKIQFITFDNFYTLPKKKNIWSNEKSTFKIF